MTPRISVVIPTHHPSLALETTIASLQAQTVPPQHYEIIVVADGCTTDMAKTIRRWSRLKVPVTVIEQPALGAAAARNRGAERARGPLLLFLDGDMEATPALLERHLAAHAARPGSLVLGHFPMASEAAGSDPFASQAKEWWEEQFHRWSSRGYRFTFKDVCSGNMSLETQRFRALGGFCEDFPSAAGEDWEFGARLLKCGVRVRFASGATSIHHSAVDFAYMLRRMEAAGFSDVLIARRHPELFWSLRLHACSRLQRHPVAWRLIWRNPALAEPIIGALKLLRMVLASLHAPRLMMRVAVVIRGHAYWCGVHKGFGTVEAWEHMMHSAPHETPDYREIDIDLARDVRDLGDKLAAQPVDAIRLFYRGTLIGRIEALSGAEALSKEHVLEEIIQRHPDTVLRLLDDLTGDATRAISLVELEPGQCRPRSDRDIAS